jgi:hypothetical protein
MDSIPQRPAPAVSTITIRTDLVPFMNMVHDVTESFRPHSHKECHREPFQGFCRPDDRTTKLVGEALANCASHLNGDNKWSEPCVHSRSFSSQR